VRAIILTFVGLIALMAVSAQAALNPNQENQRPVGAALSLALGDQGCEDGWHRALWRDWLGRWRWSPCFRVAD
jgi:hypothetical protein